MLEIRTDRAWWVALCVAAVSGCSAGTATQVVTGHVTSRDAIAVRALEGDEVVTAAQVRGDGSFALALPIGARYRLEVLTAGGVKHVLAAGDQGLGDLTFGVCAATQPWDIGGLSKPGSAGGTTCDPKTGKDCEPPKCDPKTGNDCEPPKCAPDDPTCGEPPKCDPATGKNCEPPPCAPDDPTCGEPPTCDPKTGKGCEPPPCAPDDPSCKCDPATGACQKPCSDPSAPGCGGDPTGPPPTCDDAKDPEGCVDPCAKDPSICGCKIEDPGCWGPPTAPACDGGGTCSPKDAWTPEHPPLDFGCGKGA
jgi:hypothetical protein